MKYTKKFLTLFVFMITMIIATNSVNALSAYTPGGYVVDDLVNGTVNIDKTVVSHGDPSKVKVTLYESEGLSEAQLKEKVDNGSIQAIAQKYANADGTVVFENIQAYKGIRRELDVFLEDENGNYKAYVNNNSSNGVYLQAWTPFTVDVLSSEQLTFTENEVPVYLLTDGKFDPLKTLKKATIPWYTGEYDAINYMKVKSGKVDTSKAGVYTITLYGAVAQPHYPGGTINKKSGEIEVKIVINILPKQESTGTVIIRYLEKNTNKKLIKNTVIEKTIGERYSTTPKNINGYTLVNPLPSNSKGIVKSGNIQVIYYYEKLDEIDSTKKLNNNKIAKTGSNNLYIISFLVFCILGSIIIKLKINN